MNPICLNGSVFFVIITFYNILKPYSNIKNKEKSMCPMCLCGSVYNH